MKASRKRSTREKTGDAGVVSQLGEPVLNALIRKGIRQALDAGRQDRRNRGRLLMDPQELANRIGAAIDYEVERLERIAAKRAAARKAWAGSVLARALASAEAGLAPTRRGVANAPRGPWTGDRPEIRYCGECEAGG